MKEYRNSERTKKWIRKAFSELILEKGSIANVKVNELAERADITKTTFYYHYDDLYAVAEEMENELIANLSTTLKRITKENPSNYSNYIKEIVLFLKANEKSYRMVVNASDIYIFASKLKHIFTKELSVIGQSLGFSDNYEKRSVQVYFIVSACVDTTIQCLKGQLPVSIDLVGEVIQDAIDQLKRNCK